MNALDFANAVAAERDNLVKAYFTEDSKTDVGRQISVLRLSPEQVEALRAIIHGALTDFAYTLLLGLDGEASIGHLQQQSFLLQGEDGSPLANGDGQLEAAAWEVFHEEK